jgi:probable DNA repair protein
LLQWLDGPISETELDWLFACDLFATAHESTTLQASMRTLRRKDQQRPQWLLGGFINQPSISSLLPRDWARRMIAAQRVLKESPHKQNPIEWADTVPHLLRGIGWRGSTPQNSVDFQAQRRWAQALDTAGSLGFDGRRVTWSHFLTELQHAAEDTLFAPQSVDAPIQIAGPAESAGLGADAICFLDADEDSWPAVASAHPFLPLHVQRQFGMPHASHQQDWDFSAIITRRLLASAPLVHFSFALQREDVENRPSRLIKQIAPPQTLPASLVPPSHEQPAAISIEDFSRVPYSAGHLQGGSAVLSFQSQCPFKAFAAARLGAQSWEAAEAGLSARQRGQILHDVLHSIWSGHRPGIKTHRDLIAIEDANLPAFVRKHVKPAMQSAVPAQIREQMPAMYLELEETRLIRLVAEWLRFEKTRIAFTVEAAESQSSVTIAGLTMNLRLDRVDRLHDGSQLVVDYKTGSVDPKTWDLPRPEDVQLPLYKLFGLAPLQRSLFESYGGPASGGLVFARIRTGNTCFAGRLADARETLIPDLNSNSALVKRKLTAAEESDWKDYIEALAEDFIHGRADVNPRDYPRTCERCGMQPLCRIQEPENRARFENEEFEPQDAFED